MRRLKYIQALIMLFLVAINNQHQYVRAQRSTKDNTATATDPRPQLLINLGHSSMVKSVSFSSDLTRLLTGGLADKVVILWNVSSGMELRRFEHSAYVASVALSPDGSKS